jgi:hypothetical protein
MNGLEQFWGNVKTRELENVYAPDLAALRRPLRAGFARARPYPDLALGFVRARGHIAVASGDLGGTRTICTRAPIPREEFLKAHAGA